MSIFLHPRTAVATSCVEPRAQAIALSSLFAAGALLLSASAIIGAIASLALLLALAGAFAVGNTIARCRSWSACHRLLLSRYAFLLSAVGWLLTLIAWNGFFYWAALLPGTVVGALGFGIAWRNSGRGRGLPGMAAKSVIAVSIIGVIVVVLLTAHYDGAGGSGFAYALAVLADLALLGALVVRIREQDLE